MDKEKIIDYVMQTPENSNPAVLRSLLNQLNTSNDKLIIRVNEDQDEPGTFRLDKTWQEIHDALAEGIFTEIVSSHGEVEVEINFLAYCGTDVANGEYYVSDVLDQVEYSCENPNDYPEAHVG